MWQVKANLYCKSFNKSNENIVVCKLRQIHIDFDTAARSGMYEY